MSDSRDRSSRRSFLQRAARATAATALGIGRTGAQQIAGAAPLKIDPGLLITPGQAQEWNAFKAAGGSTYAGSAGWKHVDQRVQLLPGAYPNG